MSHERVVVLGIALTFYALGGWSIYGELERQQEARATGKWPSTHAMVADAYRRDLKQHDLARPALLDYRYIGRSIAERVQGTAAPRVLSHATSHERNVGEQPGRADPAAAILAGDPTNPDYSIGFGLIGFGTLIALLRELILRRRGRYRSDAMPLAWQELRAALNKKIY
ncbi:MAG TPA: hypothetical protein VF021_01160 [Longimicrobiales bacterium]